MFTTDPMRLVKRTAFAALIIGAFTGCAPTEKTYQRIISDTITARYNNSLIVPDIVFNEMKVERVYTAGDIREIMRGEGEPEKNEIPPDVIRRLAGIPELPEEWIYEPKDLTQKELYLACRVHLKGIRNGKKLIRMVRCSYTLSFADTPFFMSFDQYYYVSANGKTCYGTHLISRW